MLKSASSLFPEWEEWVFFPALPCVGRGKSLFILSEYFLDS